MFETIWNLILPNILEVIASIISLVVAYYVIPYIKTELIPWLKEKRVYNMIKSFVQGVEKLAESGIIEKVDKKKKVIELLENKGIVVDQAVDALIESCVKELDMITSVVRDGIMESEEN